MLPDTAISDPTVSKFVDSLLSEFVNPILGLATAVAVCYFVITVIQYFAAYKNGEDLSKLKAKLVWGMVGVIIISSCWTLVYMSFSFRFK